MVGLKCHLCGSYNTCRTSDNEENAGGGDTGAQQVTSEGSQQGIQDGSTEGAAGSEMAS